MNNEHRKCIGIKNFHSISIHMIIEYYKPNISYRKHWINVILTLFYKYVFDYEFIIEFMYRISIYSVANNDNKQFLVWDWFESWFCNAVKFDFDRRIKMFLLFISLCILNTNAYINRDIDQNAVSFYLFG